MMRSRAPRSDWRRLASHRWPGVAWLCAAMLSAGTLAGCDSASSGPLATEIQQHGIVSCSDDPVPAEGIPRWDSPIIFAMDAYYNQSGQPIVIRSVTLLAPHNLRVHQALAFDTARGSLPWETGWSDEPKEVKAWSAREPVPGAVIPGSPGSGRHAIYQIAVSVTAASPAGGWAAGEIVHYTSGGQDYSFTEYTGYAIGAATGPQASSCDRVVNAIYSDWKANGS